MAMMARGAENKKCDGCGGILNYTYRDPTIPRMVASCQDCCKLGRKRWRKRSLYLEGGTYFPDAIWCEVCHSVVKTGGSTIALFHYLLHPDLPESAKAMGWTKHLLKKF